MNITPEYITRNLELYKALIAAKPALPAVEKAATATVQTRAGGTYEYSYADLADMEEAIKPVLSANGLLVDFEMHDDEHGKTWLIGILIHPDSGGYKTSEWEVTGHTNQDRGGDITYGRRYLTGVLTGVVTDKDADGKPGNTPRPPRTPRPQPVKKQANDLATDEQKSWLFQQAETVPVDDIMADVVGPHANSGNITHAQAAKLIDAIKKMQA